MFQYPYCVNRTTGTPWHHNFFNENDHTPREDHDEQYCTLGMAKIACLGGTGKV